MDELEAPLFPLNTVLFPGGTLGLRIFEPRYLEMVGSCSRGNSCFGVCLIRAGTEVGAAPTTAEMGTLARIVDFAQLPDGLLGLTVRGEQAFRIERAWVRDNGLAMGSVRLRADDPLLPVPAEYALLATVLERAADSLDGELARAPKASFDDAAWVGFRLAELLPLELEERQRLLEETDPIARLALLTEWLPRFQR